MALLNLRYIVSRTARRNTRHLRDCFSGGPFCTQQLSPLPNTIKSQTSVLYRNFPNVDRKLMEGKCANLRIAIEHINGVVISPGETFSFWRLVGNPSARRGFQHGLAIANGKPVSDTGGGLCQLGNTIHWLALHSNLQVTERHRHSLDLFPDDGRQIPFGTGVTLVYNYKDIRLHNPTLNSYQLCFHQTDSELLAELRTSGTQQDHYRIIEENHHFVRTPEGTYRSNRICRERLNNTDQVIHHEILFSNYCRCQYEPIEGEPC